VGRRPAQHRHPRYTVSPDNVPSQAIIQAGVRLVVGRSTRSMDRRTSSSGLSPRTGRVDSPRIGERARGVTA
jgi:hypothetical protein